MSLGDIDLSDASVTIASVAQTNYAWTLLNPQDLLQPAPDSGANLKVPGTDGRLGRRHTDEQQRIDLRYVFRGGMSSSGVVQSDPAAGLQLNKDDFVSSVYRATRDDEWAVTCTVVGLDGITRTGPVQVHAPRFSEGLFDCTAVVPVTLLRGELEVTAAPST
jgi:hypothetical protein